MHTLVVGVLPLTVLIPMCCCQPDGQISSCQLVCSQARQQPRVPGLEPRSCHPGSLLLRGHRPQLSTSSNSSSNTNSSSGTCPGTRALTSSPHHERQSQRLWVRCISVCLRVRSCYRYVPMGRLHGCNSLYAFLARTHGSCYESSVAACRHFTLYLEAVYRVAV